MNTWHKSLALTAFILVSVALLMGVDKAPPEPTASSVVKVENDGGHGSGVHIGNGYILSVAHILVDGKSNKVRSSDANAGQDAEVLWVNRAYDVSLLRIEAHDAIGVSPLSCRVPFGGEPISAGGNPRFVEFLTLYGFVSGPPRPIAPWKVAVPIDLSVVEGMSGGPVFDANGRVIGLSSGFIPSATGFGGSWSGVGAMVPGSAICSLMARV